jgi:hypothetical protein
MFYSQSKFQFVTRYDHRKTFDGYTLFAPMGPGYVWLVDMEGNFVHNWEMKYLPGEHGRLLENGNLLYAGKVIPGPLNNLGGFGGILIEKDWDGNVVWEHEDLYQHHDFYRMSNGNTMILRWVEIPEDIASEIKGGITGTEHDGRIWTDSFQEITPDGDIVWDWFGYKHLDTNTDIICPLCPRSEWSHANSCFVLPNGDILTTFLRTNTIAIIDRVTGDIKWRWGQDILAHPHDPTMLDNGNILVFDNGIHRKLAIPNYSRVLEVNPLTSEIEWEYKDNPAHHFYGSQVSGCQRLPNGNTLICEGTTGRIFEVTPEKETVWEFYSPFCYNVQGYGWTNQIFRAYRFGPNYDGLQGRILNPETFNWVLQKNTGSNMVKVYESLDDDESPLEKRLRALGY